MPTPEAGTRRLTIAEALREAVAEEMRRDESVFLIGEDIGVEGGFGGAFGVYLGLAEEFGHERVIDTPISEKAIAGAAVGAALAGMRPIADMQYSDFLFECMDELVNQAAKMRLMSGGRLSVPMVMRAPVGATTRGAQHGQSPESFFVHVPGLKVVCVSDAYHAKGLLKSAVRDDNPVLVFEHKLLYGSKGREQAGGLDLTAEVPEEEYLVPLGKAVVKREGRDVTLVATHVSLYRSLAAAAELADEGIDCEVIDPLTLLPLDTDTLWASVRKTGRLVIVHEDTLHRRVGRRGGSAGGRRVSLRARGTDQARRRRSTCRCRTHPCSNRRSSRASSGSRPPSGRCARSRWPSPCACRRSARPPTSCASSRGGRRSATRSPSARRCSTSRPTRRRSRSRRPSQARCCGSSTEEAETVRAGTVIAYVGSPGEEIVEEVASASATGSCRSCRSGDSPRSAGSTSRSWSGAVPAVASSGRT